MTTTEADVQPFDEGANPGGDKGREVTVTRAQITEVLNKRGNLVPGDVKDIADTTEPDTAGSEVALPVNTENASLAHMVDWPAITDAPEARQDQPEYEITHDLSEITKGEDYIPALYAELGKLDDESLVVILEAAAGPWGRFDLDSFGFRLPNELSKLGYNKETPPRLVDLPDEMSPLNIFLSHVALELWFRKLDGVLKKKSTGSDHSQEITSVNELESLADILFKGIHSSEGSDSPIITDFETEIMRRKGIPESGRRGIYVQAEVDVFKELMNPNSVMNETVISMVDNNRLEVLNKAIHTIFLNPKWALKMDMSIAGEEVPPNGLPYGEINLNTPWHEGIKKFVEQYKRTTPQESATA